MTNRYLIDFYRHYDEDGRLASRHGSVEFLTTMHYIEKYLRPGFRILEIGAGTGRYSHALARRGYEVSAVELVEHNIEVLKENTEEGENLSVFHGNALDLSFLSEEQYDLTLLLGPLYHLYTDASLSGNRRLHSCVRSTWLSWMDVRYRVYAILIDKRLCTEVE